jgi:hypothetical protein
VMVLLYRYIPQYLVSQPPAIRRSLPASDGAILGEDASDQS